MAESIISSVVESLGKLLIQEANFLSGVSGKVKQMQTELQFMQGFLEDADKRQDPDKRIQTLVSEIREAAYEVEIVIEAFALKIESRRRGGIQNAFKRCVCIFDEAEELHKVGSQIKEITSRISNLTRSSQTYVIQPITSHDGEASSSAQGIQRRRQRRQSYGHVIEEYTVGLERDVEILVAQLVNEEENCGSGVVSICGMGGLGKTTLAKKVFHHNGIRRHFDGFAWAYISQQCQKRDVWEGILFKLDSTSDAGRERIKSLRDDEIAEKLYQVLQEKKCLVIVDDIWTAEAWHDLLPAFAVGKAGSKVLLTTRNKEVAPSSFLHEPRCLNEEESLELLLKKAFPAGKHDDPDFINNKDVEKLGRKMVERCKRLPLAIIVLGAILATKCTLSEWKIVDENISSNLRRAKGQVQQESDLFDVLALSYHELPYHLKACFLHLSHFPEDFEIPTKKLVRLWVAEGIVSSTQCEVMGEETILEDIALDYLSELMYRCMVQVGAVGSTGRVKTCHLHDLMRDLCLMKASQENFLEVIHLQDVNKQVDSLSSTHQLHRLLVYFGEEDLIFFPKQQRALDLRSLSFFNTQASCYSIRITPNVKLGFSDFKLLKILDLEQCDIGGKLTSTIGNLIHLRYLSLYFCDSAKLPSSIGNLRCLQTLILGCREYRVKKVQIPNAIWRMEQLRHLYLPTSTIVRYPLIPFYTMTKYSGKLRVDNFRDLHTLKGFDSRIFDIKGLAKLTRLKKLQIRVKSLKELMEIQRSLRDTFNCILSLYIVWCTEEDEETDIIAKETDLQGLLSGCPNLCKLFLSGLKEKLPEFHRFEYPSNLTKLVLQYSKLEEDPMATLEKLPNLSILKLGWDSFVGKKMVCSSKGFPRLKSLGLVSVRNLEEWFVGEEAMPCLCELTIEKCEMLEMVPDGLRFITTLHELKIVGMPEEFKSRLRGGVDSFKVQHVPSIIFKDWS